MKIFLFRLKGTNKYLCQEIVYGGLLENYRQSTRYTFDLYTQNYNSLDRLSISPNRSLAAQWVEYCKDPAGRDDFSKEVIEAAIANNIEVVEFSNVHYPS